MQQRITINRVGYTRLCRGSKRIVAYYLYDTRNRECIKIEYYDEAFNHRYNNTGCCQRPTFARTEIGAKRMINKFFNS